MRTPCRRTARSRSRNFRASPDARFIAYTLSEGGADWQTVHVREIATGRDLPEALKWMRFSVLSWTKDSRRFLLFALSRAARRPRARSALSGHALYYHRLGTPQSADRLIYERKDAPTDFVFGWVTENGRYLVVETSKAAGPRRAASITPTSKIRGGRDIGAPVKPIVEDDDLCHAVRQCGSAALHPHGPRRADAKSGRNRPARSARRTMEDARTRRARTPSQRRFIGGRMVLNT